MSSHRREAVSVANFRAVRNDPRRGSMAAKPTLEAIALLGEFGFEFVAADQVGEPTPGRIADRLSEIIATLEEAIARGNLGAVHQATEKLKRLQQSIDVWSLLASQLDDDQPVPQPSPVVAPVPSAPPRVHTAPPAPPVPAPPAPPVQVAPPPPVQVAPPLAPPVQVAPPAPVQVASPAPVQVAPPSPPVQAAPPPVDEYPMPPVAHDGSVDVEQLERAAAGTQQAFWQAIGQTPGDGKK
jgi:outer membrane biosynthesis protein TonB